MKEQPTGAGKPRRARTPAAGSRQANRRAALILEVLAGVRTAPQAAQLLAISTNHYYLLERRALAGLLAACEPVPKGKRPCADKQLASLQQQLARCQQECQRQTALVRALQRTAGIPAPPSQPERQKNRRSGNKPTQRRRRARVRALRMAEQLHQKAADEPPDGGSTSVVSSTGNTPSGNKESHDGA